MPDADDLDQRQQQRIREWLLLLLRFAITRDPRDEAAAFVMADELDALGLYWRPSAPGFFLRTSRDVCAAIGPPSCADMRAASTMPACGRRSKRQSACSSLLRVRSG
jgi:hypothetical protein